MRFFKTFLLFGEVEAGSAVEFSLLSFTGGSLLFSFKVIPEWFIVLTLLVLHSEANSNSNPLEQPFTLFGTSSLFSKFFWFTRVSSAVSVTGSGECCFGSSGDATLAILSSSSSSEKSSTALLFLLFAPQDPLLYFIPCSSSLLSASASSFAHICASAVAVNINRVRYTVVFYKEYTGKDVFLFS